MGKRKYMEHHGTHRHCSGNGLSEENTGTGFSRTIHSRRLNGAADRFKEDLIEIFIFSLPPRETIVRIEVPTRRETVVVPFCARAHYYLFMRFDEGTILGIYPDLFTLAVARNCLAFVRRARIRRGARVYRICLGAISFPRKHFRRKIRRSVHPDIWQGRALLGLLGSLCTKGSSPRASSLPEIESHPRAAPEKLGALLPRNSGDS